MIHVIYGAKGSGKTKQIVDDANAYAVNAKGVVVYFDRSNHRMHDLHRNIRLVDASHYGLMSQNEILAFLKGMLAANFDIEMIYIDGLSRLLDCNVKDLGELYTGLEAIGAEHSVNFTITASGAKEDLPAFITKHIK
ncbi:MAG: twitching motility protein PilT [Clostridia bacterium]|nr:twitching motility protein PilT [Clostridia bacterium]